MTTVRDVLTTPFLLISESVETEDGEWMRKLSYPELSCSVVADNVLEALDQLEIDRVRALVAALERESSLPVAVAREPVADVELPELLEKAELHPWIARLDEPLSPVPPAG